MRKRKKRDIPVKAGWRAKLLTGSLHLSPLLGRTHADSFHVSFDYKCNESLIIFATNRQPAGGYVY